MQNQKFDSFKDLRTSKYDWNVPARVLNFWRGYSTKGEAFKSFNLLLIDHKRSRIHAFAPGSVAEALETNLQIGDIYLFQNFTVKEYKVSDKFRPLRKPIQIQFGSETVIKQMLENEINIESCWFDFYDLADLEPLSKQTAYLTDVIGIMEAHDPVGKVKNRNGVIQDQIKFNITDGSTSTNVTFWDDFAVMFGEKLKKDKQYPRILIIGSARIQKWSDEVVITNVGATSIYLNCNHHSVIEMRKSMSQKDFSQSKLSTPVSRCTTIFKLRDVKMLGAEHIDREVLCEVQIKKFQDVKSWCHPICTSCYEKIYMIEKKETCLKCQRIVPYGEKIFEIYTEAVDDTASTIVILQDREVRTLIGKRALQLIDEGMKEVVIPDCFQALQNKFYTIKLLVSEKNVLQKDNCYLARDIMHGLYSQLKQKQQESYPHPIDDMSAEPSGSSCKMGSSSTYNLASDC